VRSAACPQHRVVLNGSGMKSFALHYDRDYGCDRRRGWTVVVDGRIIVQFRKWAWLALAEAFVRLHCCD
jgi:hypothetical protein